LVAVDDRDVVHACADLHECESHHGLRHTCFTRLREAGMSIEALQAQAGHRSIASTQLSLHLGDGWLANEYRRVAEVIEAQASVGMPR
jgi:integrase/recombinase XerD